MKNGTDRILFHSSVFLCPHLSPTLLPCNSNKTKAGAIFPFHSNFTTFLRLETFRQYKKRAKSIYIKKS
nr:MAG TPA: hypothetical protein [Caudoviricetes sp.]